MSNFGNGMKSKTEEILENFEELVELSFKASGSSIMDTLSGLDANTGAMIGGAMTLYKNSRELMVMYGQTMDQMLKTLEEFKRMNQEIYEQNKELRRMLQDINRKVAKPKE